MSNAQVTEFQYKTPGAAEVEATMLRIAAAGKKIGTDVSAGGTIASAALKTISGVSETAQDKMREMGHEAGIAGQFLSKMGPWGMAAAAGVGTLVKVMAEAAEINERQSRIMAQTNAIIRTTGQQAGKTAEDIKELGDELEHTMMLDDETVMKVANTLMTFKGISGEVFNDVIKRSQDLAVSGFGTLETNVKALGKALQDPVEGMTALKRLGIDIDPSQRKLIQNLADTNHMLEAQKEILEAVKQKVGGAGEAEHTGLKGAIHDLNVEYEDFLKTINTTAATDTAAAGVHKLADAFKYLKTFTDTSTENQLNVAEQGLASKIAGLKSAGFSDSAIAGLPAIKEAQQWIETLKNLKRIEGEIAQERKDEAEENAKRAAERQKADDEEAARQAWLLKFEKDNANLVGEVNVEMARKRGELAKKREEESKRAQEDLKREQAENAKLTEEMKFQAWAADLLNEAYKIGGEMVDMTKANIAVETELRKLNKNATQAQREELEKLTRSKIADEQETERKKKKDAEDKANAEKAEKDQKELLDHQKKMLDDWMNETSRDFRNFWLQSFSGSLRDILPNTAESIMKWWIGLQAEMLARPLLMPFAPTQIAGAASGGGYFSPQATASGASGAGFLSSVGSMITGSSSLYNSTINFTTSKFGQALGLSGVVDEFGTIVPTAFGANLAQGVSASPWGIVGSLGASLMGLKGTGNAIADFGLGTIGSIGGGMAGSAMLGTALGSAAGPVGAIVGAFLAQALGSLFASKPSDKLEATRYNFLTGERTQADLGPNKDSPENRKVADGLTDTFLKIKDVIEQATGGKINATGLLVQAGDRSKINYEYRGADRVYGGTFDTPEQAFKSMMEGMVDTIDKVSPEMKEALKKIDWSDLDKAAKSMDAIVSFEGAIASLDEKVNTQSPIQQSLAAIKKQFEDWRTTLIPLGITLEEINSGEQRTLDKLRTTANANVDDQILQIKDPRQYELNQLDKEFEGMREDARALGLDMTKIEELYGAKRAAIIKKYAEQALQVTQQAGESLADQILAIKDPQAYELKKLDAEKAEMIKNASTLGYTLADIEELTGLKRAAIVKKYADEILKEEERARQEAEKAEADAAARARELIVAGFDMQINLKNKELDAAKQTQSAWSQVYNSLKSLALQFNTGADTSGMTLEQRQADLMQRLEAAYADLQAGHPEAADTIQALAGEAASATKAFYQDNAQGTAVMKRIRDIVNGSAATAESQLNIAQTQVNLLQAILNTLQAQRGVIAAGPSTPISAATAAKVTQQYGDARQSFLNSSAGSGGDLAWVQTDEFKAWENVRDTLVAGTTDPAKLAESAAAAKSQIADPVYHDAGVSYLATVNKQADALGLPHFDNGGIMPQTGLALLHKNEVVLNQSGQGGMAQAIQNLALHVSNFTAMMTEAQRRTGDALARIVKNTEASRSNAMLAAMVGA